MVMPMSAKEKLLLKVLSGTKDKDIAFAELCRLLNELGFQCRIKGDHHIFYRDAVEEILNLQPIGKVAKPYQVKQVRGVIVKYRLGDMNHV